MATEKPPATRGRTPWWRSHALVYLTAWLAIGFGMLLPPNAGAGENPVEVTVTEPVLDVHTGPGRGYPVFYVAERGETVQILMRRTEWFKVRTARNQEGWVSVEQIEKTVMSEGVQQNLRDAVLGDYLHKRIEAGVAIGAFDGDPIVSFRAGYMLTDNLVAELRISEVAGTFSNSQLYTGNLMLQPYTDLRFSPYFTIGAGDFENRNRASLVGSTSTLSATTANAGFGARYYLTRNFLLQLDYRQHLVLTNVQKNDRFNEESIGLSFFF